MLFVIELGRHDDVRHDTVQASRDLGPIEGSRVQLVVLSTVFAHFVSRVIVSPDRPDRRDDGLGTCRRMHQQKS